MDGMTQESRITLNRLEELLCSRDTELEKLKKANAWLAMKLVERPTISFRKCPPIMFTCPYSMVTRETCATCWCEAAEERLG